VTGARLGGLGQTGIIGRIEKEGTMSDLIAIGYPDETTAEAAAARHGGWPRPHF
jgi:hypothetical protein